MSRKEKAFFDDVPSSLKFMGEVAFGSELPKEAPPGSLFMVVLYCQDGSLNALYFIFRGNSGIWHEYVRKDSPLLASWIHLQNDKFIRSRSWENPDHRPWERYKK